MGRPLLASAKTLLPALAVHPACPPDKAKRGKRLRAGGVAPLGRSSPALPAEAGRRCTVRHEGLAPQPATVSVQVR